MSRNTALDELIQKLEREADQLELGLGQQRSTRDRAQELCDHEESRLLDKRDLIEFLKAVAEEEADPEWKVGDRFYLPEWQPGHVTDIQDGIVRAFTDDGVELLVELDNWKKQARWV